ncbi:hypothetical protein SAMN05421820_103602 [Pedobacter steynii]|uniref:Uncharacterized protein n=1 Tax=Pedobacter steynii TaxID=430522 RepID=A0A1G9SH86_9SPHI|nr:hypothetical protein [Pedobacter steynii]NQX37416.1 hypothetical protein [Pedobacter steynii]SDM34833.1 hypothetical protein SAMN05421820_103602 [Pedobacter steynii]
MRKLILVSLIGIALYAQPLSALTNNHHVVKDGMKTVGQAARIENEDYVGQVIFHAGYAIGDYIEFVGSSPINAGSSGNYEISISYTRGNIATAATYWASVAHAGQTLWREVGRVNSNGYHNAGSLGHNFTVDCNTESGNPRFRIRAINTLGIIADDIGINIRIRSINFNGGWRALNQVGNDLTVSKFLPMTNDWSLYVGNTSNVNGATVAIKVVENGNVGIGTDKPNSKLAVNGNIRAHEIKVETANWPDYVFAKSYLLPSLDETESYIKEKGHLPGIPSAVEVAKEGIDLGEMNGKLLKKIEELTLHLINERKANAENQKRWSEGLKKMEKRVKKLEKYNRYK